MHFFMINTQEAIVMNETIKEVLIRRDGMSPDNADELILQAKRDLEARLDRGEMPFDICEKWFGLEADYLEELIPINRIGIV